MCDREYMDAIVPDAGITKALVSQTILGVGIQFS